MSKAYRVTVYSKGKMMDIFASAPESKTFIEEFLKNYDSIQEHYSSYEPKLFNLIRKIPDQQGCSSYTCLEAELDDELDLLVSKETNKCKLWNIIQREVLDQTLKQSLQLELEKI